MPQLAAAKAVMSRPRVAATVQIVAGALLFGLVAVAVARDWRQVHAALSRISPWQLVLSELLILLAAGATVLVWRRSLIELGSSVRIRDASKIYLVGQLGKYVPGTVWAFFLSMEMARKAGVPRTRSMTASIVAVCINFVTGLAVGALVISSVAHGDVWRYVAVAAICIVLVAGLSPPILTRIVNVLMGLTKRPGLERPVTWSGMLKASGWSLVTRLAYGLSLWILAVAVGAPAGRAFPLCLAGIALAKTAGLIVVVAPSGIGGREAVLVAALAPVLETGEALAVALVVRLLFTLGDLLAAAVVSPVRIERTTS
jgi:glycosyltransferase 2 family protein